MPPSPIGIENNTRHTKENTDHRGNLPRPHGYRKRYPSHKRNAPIQTRVSKTIPGSRGGATFSSTLLAFLPFRFVFAVGDGLQGEVV